MFRSCPIYRALLKTADESANYKKISPLRMKKRIQPLFSGLFVWIPAEVYPAL